MERIVNTEEKEFQPEWLRGGNPNAIERQEKRGQDQLVSSVTRLPVECDQEDMKALVEMGVVFGDPIEDDPIFCKATLPEGWKIEGTDHSLWSKLVDQDGIEKASIFYKAAFYDRSAFIRLA